ncbi:diacylglycerol kinase family lipid kinase [candidate division KSB1 bacterium]|nr:diacylglycerol kinase family lipid kinase [candidate division KSB1 bacterium]
MKAKLVYTTVSRPAKIRRYLSRVIRLFRENGWDLDVVESKKGGDTERWARQSVGRYDVFIVAGGDGTINKALNGLAGSKLSLAILPFGTGNVLALELGIPSNPIKAADRIIHGQPRPFDLGKIGSRYFSMMAGFGLDALVVCRVNLTLKKFIGKTAYILTALQKLPDFHPPKILVNGNGFSEWGRFVVVANIRHYAGRFQLAPRARVDDGFLDVIIFKKGTLGRYLYYLANVLLKRHIFLSDVIYFQTRKINIQQSPLEIFQIDGDPGAGMAASEITIAPGAVQIII